MRASGVLWLAAIVLVGGVLLPGCGEEGGGKVIPSQDGGAVHLKTIAKGKTPSVAYLTNGVASFWTIAQSGAQQGAREAHATVDVRMPSGVVNQKEMIQDLLTRGVDGIAISPIDPANQVEIINKACTVTNVITHDSDAPGTHRLCYIGMDNYKAGRMCGALVKEAIPNGGMVMIFIGRLEQDNARRRRQGVIDELLGRDYDPMRYDPPGKELKSGDYTILGTLTDQFDRAQGKANVEDAISRYPELDCMVGLFAYNPPLMLEVLKQAGKLGAIKVVGFDEADETLQGIKDGTVYGTVVQNPFEYGRQSVIMLAALARGDASVLPEGGFVDIPARQIRPDNVDAFWAELKKNLGKR